LYVIFGFLAGILGTLFSVVIRMELSTAGDNILAGNYQLYNVIITGHAFFNDILHGYACLNWRIWKLACSFDVRCTGYGLS